MDRWKEYGAELFERSLGESPLTEVRTHDDEQEPPPLLSEVEHSKVVENREITRYRWNSRWIC